MGVEGGLLEMQTDDDYLGPAVDPGTRDLRYTSVSAATKFDVAEYGGCERRWYFRYVMRLKEPPSAATELGTKIHLQIEHYLKTGENGLGAIARAGVFPIHLFPQPGKDLFVEQKLNVDLSLDSDGVPFVGKVDWINPRGVYVAPDGQLLEDPPGTIEVGDNKTTSKLGFEKKGEDLVNTLQMSGYGFSVGRRFPELKFVRLSHLYLQTKTPKAKKVTALFPLETVKRRWYEVAPLIRRMKGVAKAQSFEEVSGNEESCKAYNKPCPYLSYCFKNPIRRLQVSMLNKARALVSGNRSGNGATEAVSVSSIPMPMASTPAVPAPVTKKSLIEDLSTTPDNSGIPASSAVQNAVYALPGGVTGAFLCATEHQGTKYSFSTGLGLPVLLKPEERIYLKQAAQSVAVALAAPIAPPSVVAQAIPPASSPAVEERARRGRPKKVSEEETKPSTSVTPTSISTTPEPTTELRLFVNCIPNGEFETLDKFVLEMARSIEKQFNVVDMRCATGESPLAFGRWKGVVKAVVQNEPPTGTFVAFTRGNELTEAVVEALGLLCGPGNLIRGV